MPSPSSSPVAAAVSASTARPPAAASACSQDGLTFSSLLSSAAGSQPQTSSVADSATPEIGDSAAETDLGDANVDGGAPPPVLPDAAVSAMLAQVIASGAAPAVVSAIMPPTQPSVQATSSDAPIGIRAGAPIPAGELDSTGEPGRDVSAIPEAPIAGSSLQSEARVAGSSLQSVTPDASSSLKAETAGVAAARAPKPNGPDIAPALETTGKPAPRNHDTAAPVVSDIPPAPMEAAGNRLVDDASSKPAVRGHEPVPPGSREPRRAAAPEPDPESPTISSSASAPPGGLPAEPGTPVRVRADMEPNLRRADAVVGEPFDIRHTDYTVVTSSTTTPQARFPEAPMTGASAILTGSSPAANFSAAVSQDNQQPVDRNVAMERSTMMSLGGVSAGSSNSKTDAGSSAGNGGGSREDERRSPDRSAAHSPDHEAAVAVITPSPVVTKLAPTAATPHLDTGQRAEVAEQVAQHIDTMRLASGRHEVTVHLRPDHLGDLRVTIVADRQEVTARIVADTAAARDAVTEGHERLRSALEQKGYSLQGLDVSLGGSSHQRFAQDAHMTPAPTTSRPASSNSTRDPSSDQPPSAAPLRPAGRGSGRLDYQA